MSTTTDLSTLKINYLTQEQYDAAIANNQINSDELYLTPGTSLESIIKRTDAVDVSNISYSTTMVRGIYFSATDLTAGTSTLTNGTICLVYE